MLKLAKILAGIVATAVIYHSSSGIQRLLAAEGCT